MWSEEQGRYSECLTKAELAAQLRRSIRSLDRWALTGGSQRSSGDAALAPSDEQYEVKRDENWMTFSASS